MLKAIAVMILALSLMACGTSKLITKVELIPLTIPAVPSTPTYEPVNWVALDCVSAENAEKFEVSVPAWVEVVCVQGKVPPLTETQQAVIMLRMYGVDEGNAKSLLRNTVTVKAYAEDLRMILESLKEQNK